MNLNVVERGEGAPIVFIHGLGASLESWDEEVAHFAKQHRTIAYDARGHGQSSRGGKFGLEHHVEDLRCLLDALGIDHCTVMGASMGSYIAQGFAATYPQRVKELALIVTKSNGATSSSARILEEHKLEVEHLTHRETQEFLLGFAFGPYVDPIKKDAHIKRLMRSLLSEDEMAAAGGALVGFDFRGILPKISAKTIVISGAHDRLNPPQEGAACASLIPGSRFVELSRSGHFPVVEQADDYFQALDSLLG
ncbi:alpha/beta fold hydrolase [Cupriavidus sp. 2TAF22]|uniref:alpha/beta fold hydrolase n=1 Tax=unclassified Cupriavidus TaxID=2640874 RepID=UPI003F90FB8E